MDGKGYCTAASPKLAGGHSNPTTPPPSFQEQDRLLLPPYGSWTSSMHSGNPGLSLGTSRTISSRERQRNREYIDDASRQKGKSLKYIVANLTISLQAYHYSQGTAGLLIDHKSLATLANWLQVWQPAFGRSAAQRLTRSLCEVLSTQTFFNPPTPLHMCRTCGSTKS